MFQFDHVVHTRHFDVHCGGPKEFAVCAFIDGDFDEEGEAEDGEDDGEEFIDDADGDEHFEADAPPHPDRHTPRRRRPPAGGQAPERRPRGAGQGMVVGMKRLPVLLREGEDGWIVAECPAIPGCVSQGRTREEALTNIREAILLSLDQQGAEGWELPRGVEVVLVDVGG